MQLKLSLFSKLFISIFVASTTTLLVMMLFFNWSFKAGFIDYINNSELIRVEQLAHSLGRYYEDEGDWTFLNEQVSVWPLLLMQLSETMGATSFVNAQQNVAVSAPLPLASRIVLLDQTQHPIATGSLSSVQLLSLPFSQVAVLSESQQVGWLRVYQDQKINLETSGKLASNFIQQQISDFSLVALFATLLSFVLATLLVKHFLRPVQALSQGAARLSQGEYEHRIPVYALDEIGQLTRDFNKLAVTLNHQKEMRQQWVADISHELRTPLTALRCEIEAIQDGIVPNTQGTIDGVHSTVLTMTRLVEDLHQLAISDSGMLATPNQIIDVNETLKDIIIQFQTRFSSKSISIKMKLSTDEPLHIYAEENLLNRIFVNVIENSLRYTNHGGEVQIDTFKDTNWVEVNIQDSSPSVTPEQLPHLFERLYRVDKSRSREFGGSGLGLSICQNLVKAHNGIITASISPLGGLSMVIRFPLTSAGKFIQ
jgi:two-component system sensor histidine kinase BaeS